MSALPFSFAHYPPHRVLLNSLEGVCYICSFDGEILAVGEDNWREFANGNGAPQIFDGSKLIGTSIFRYVSGAEVIAAYQSCFDEIRSQRSRTVSFTFRCDAPDVRRDMRMCLSGIYLDGVACAVLFQSLTIDERERPAVSLFDFANARAADAALPIIALCSYCHDVKLDGAWVTAEQYYKRGGAERVRISHGICPKCYDTKVPRCDAA